MKKETEKMDQKNFSKPLSLAKVQLPMHSGKRDGACPHRSNSVSVECLK